jgi:hypothetical protein
LTLNTTTTATTGTTGFLDIVPIIRKFVRQTGTTERDEGYDACGDGHGNSIVVGITEGDLGGKNEGLIDGFATEYDDKGNVNWSIQFGTIEADKANGIIFDEERNMYIVGSTEGSMNGNINHGSGDLFIIKV